MRNIHIVMDGMFEKKSQSIYSTHMSFDKFGYRILSNFDTATIHARAYDVSSPSGLLVTSDNIQFKTIANYKGFKSFAKQLPKIISTLNELSKTNDPVVLYVPGTIPFIFSFLRRLRKKPIYALVVADPADQLSKGAMRHLLRAPARIIFRYLMKSILRASRGALYVTSSYLQSRYPIEGNGRTFSSSDVIVPDDFFVSEPKTVVELSKPQRFIYVAQMSQYYKGHDILIKAMHILKESGVEFTLTLVGDGALRPSLEEVVSKLNLEDRIVFKGKLAHGPKFTEALDSSTMFLMPSRAEGLPRALVEAMARALPAVGTRVGGIPELLPDVMLVDPDSAESLASKLQSLINNPNELAISSDYNLKKSHNFKRSNIDTNISEFYKYIADDNYR